MMRDIISHVFKVQKFMSVTTSGSVKDAMDILEKRPVDLVLLELLISGESGIDLVKKVKSKGLNVRMILVTVLESKEKVMEALKAGVHDVVIKPIVPKVIMEKSIRQLKMAEVEKSA